MILKIENLSKSYGKQQVLSDINIELNENECLGIMGESGSGKSTLAKLLVRLEKEYNGIIEYDNINYEKLNDMNTTNHYILNCINTLLLTYSLSARSMQVTNELKERH